MKKFYTLFFISILANSCTDLTNSRNDTIVEVSKDFSIRLVERLDTAGGTFLLDVESTINQSCNSATIDYSISRQLDRLSVTLRNISKLPSCGGDPAPARANIELGHFDYGSPTLKISLRDAVQSDGVLRINQDNALLEMQSENGILTKDRLLLRLPRRLIWGVVGADQIQAVNAFLDSLNQKTTAMDNMTLGNYGYFTLKNARLGEIELPQKANSGKPSKMTFVRQIPIGQSADIQRMIQRYRTTMEIKVQNSEGNLF